MKIGSIVVGAGLALALVAGVVGTRRATGAEDEAKNVGKRCHAFVEAWNKHDAEGMAAVFGEDGDAIDPSGRRAAGRAEVQKMFEGMHGEQGPMRESAVVVKEEPIRFPTADVAVSDATVEVTGAYGPDGRRAGAMTMHVTDVWRKTDGQWWVFSCRPYVVNPSVSEPPR